VTSRPVIPIRLERAQSLRTTRVVEWKLSNVCNFDCSFCPALFKDGSKRFLSYDLYADTVARLIEQDPNKKVWFQFTGGEPTLYPRLIELLTYIQSLGGYTSMISNGSRTMRWWRELADAAVLNRLYLSHHPEQGSSVDHTVAVNDLMQATKAMVTVFVTAPHSVPLFDRAVEDHAQILLRARAMASLKPITDARGLLPYTDEQKAILTANLYVSGPRYAEIAPIKRLQQRLCPPYSSLMTMSYSDGSMETQEVQKFLAQGQTAFLGWQCDIGQDLLVIEVDQVYRSVCGQGGMIGRVGDPLLTWAKDGVICEKSSCSCGLDLQEPKRFIPRPTDPIQE